MLNTVWLFVEGTLVIAAIYLFQITRKQIADLQIFTEGLSANKRNVAGAVDLDMIADVTSLIGEIQSAVSEARTDLLQEKETLQQLLVQAETVAAELRIQLVQQQTMGKPTTIDTTSSQRTLEALGHISSVLTLEAMVCKFGRQLQTDGRSDRTVRDTLKIIRDFSSWLGGYRCMELTLEHISTQDLEAYSDLLWKKGYAPATVRRKLSTLQKFVDWAKTDEATHNKASVETGCSTPTFDTNDASLPNADRHQVVFELANQGLDNSTIASRTGLEQEAVRLLLLTRHKEDKIEKTFFPLGMSLPHLYSTRVSDEKHQLITH